MGSHFQTIMTLHSFLFPSQARLHFPVLPHFVLIFPDAHSGCQCSLSLTSLPSLCWIIQSKATGQGQWLWREGAAAQSRLTEIERSGKDTPCAQRGGGALVLEPVNGEEGIHLRQWCLFMNQKMGLQMKLPWHEGEHWSVWASEDEEDLGVGKPALEFGTSPTLQSRIRTADSGSEKACTSSLTSFATSSLGRRQKGLKWWAHCLQSCKGRWALSGGQNRHGPVTFRRSHFRISPRCFAHDVLS